MNRKVVGTIAVALVVGAAVPAVVVATTTTIITPDATAVGVKVGTKLDAGSAVQFQATIGFFTVKSTCTQSSWSFVATTQEGTGPFTLSTFNTAAHPGEIVANTPSFKSCTDNLGGSDTAKTHKAGSWKVSYTNPNPSDSGDTNHLELTIPTRGVTITSTASEAANCTIIVSDTGPTTLQGGYDNLGNLTFWNQSVHYAAVDTSSSSPHCTLNGDSGAGTFSVVQSADSTSPGNVEVAPKIFGVS